ncbi:MAG: hypothetical protein WBW41_20350 [Verrucomicrobiia bacterium]
MNCSSHETVEILLVLGVVLVLEKIIFGHEHDAEDKFVGTIGARTVNRSEFQRPLDATLSALLRIIVEVEVTRFK